eukprot:7284242-Prymnesium_polylepis.2
MNLVHAVPRPLYNTSRRVLSDLYTMSHVYKFSIPHATSHPERANRPDRAGVGAHRATSAGTRHPEAGNARVPPYGAPVGHKPWGPPATRNRRTRGKCHVGSSGKTTTARLRSGGAGGELTAALHTD